MPSRSTPTMTECRYCQKQFAAKGLLMHERHCQKRSWLPKTGTPFKPQLNLWPAIFAIAIILSAQNGVTFLFRKAINSLTWTTEFATDIVTASLDGVDSILTKAKNVEMPDSLETSSKIVEGAEGTVEWLVCGAKSWTMDTAQYATTDCYKPGDPIED